MFSNKLYYSDYSLFFDMGEMFPGSLNNTSKVECYRLEYIVLQQYNNIANKFSIVLIEITVII